jgi:putative sterol carrier protein
MAAEGVAAAIQEIFEEMPKHLNPDSAAGVDAVVQFNLTGNGGGNYFVEIRDGAAVVTEGEHPSPNMSMTLSAADYVALTQGKLNSQLAFMNGKLKIAGDMGLAMKIPTLFDRR